MVKKKAQEEIVGFVLVILVVAVIFLVFLGIAVRKSDTREKTENTEVSQFLDAALQFTIEDCIIRGIQPAKLKEVIKACKDNNKCNPGESNEKPACEVYSETARAITENSWKINDKDTPISGYSFKATSDSSTGSSQAIGNEIINHPSSSPIIAEVQKPIGEGITVHFLLFS